MQKKILEQKNNLATNGGKRYQVCHYSDIVHRAKEMEQDKTIIITKQEKMVRFHPSKRISNEVPTDW